MTGLRSHVKRIARGVPEDKVRFIITDVKVVSHMGRSQQWDSLLEASMLRSR